MARLSASSSIQILIATAFALCFNEFSHGQAATPPGSGFLAKRFTFGAGASYSLKEDKVPAGAGIVLVPRLFLTTTYADFSVTFDPSPQLFYSLSDSQKVSDKLFFQLPAMLHVNIGHLASKDFYSSFGFVAGGGWNFQFGRGKSTNSFIFDGGVRFWLFRQSFTVLYQRMTANEKVFSSSDFFSLQINLGKYLSQVKANNKVSNFMKPYRDKK